MADCTPTVLHSETTADDHTIIDTAESSSETNKSPQPRGRRVYQWEQSEVFVIDTQEQYVLAYKGYCGAPNSAAQRTWDALVGVINEVDPAAQYMATGKFVTQELRDEVDATLGETIAIHEGKSCIVEQVSSDIALLDDFVELKHRYTSPLDDLTRKPSPAIEFRQWLRPTIAYRGGPTDEGPSRGPSEEGTLQSFRERDVLSAGVIDPLYPSYPLNPSTAPTGADCEGYAGVDSWTVARLTKAAILNSTQRTILWSKLHNMSVVYEQCTGTDQVRAEDVCKSIRTLEIVEVITPDPCQEKHIVDFFHTRVFDSLEQLKTKLDCFTQLYTSKPSSSETERDQVQRMLKEGFVLSSDPGKKIRASELLNIISARLSITNTEQAPGFKHRLPGYLLEAGLKKKRLADGIHYYGVEPTVTTSMFSSKAVTLEDLEKQREEQFEDFKKITRWYGPSIGF